MAFTYAGLRKLTPGADAVPGDAFRLGLAKRSLLLGDPSDATAEGNPAKWIVGGSNGELDALIIVAGDNQDVVKARSDELRKRLEAPRGSMASPEGKSRSISGHSPRSSDRKRSKSFLLCLRGACLG